MTLSWYALEFSDCYSANFESLITLGLSGDAVRIRGSQLSSSRDSMAEVKGKREKFIVPVAVKMSLDHTAGNDIKPLHIPARLIPSLY